MRQARRPPEAPVVDRSSRRRQPRPSEPPVFVDRSGRRRRLTKVVGACVGAALVGVLALLVIALSGAAPVHVPGFADPGPNANSEPTAPAMPTAPGATPNPGQLPTAPGTNTSTTAAPNATTSKGRSPTQKPSHPRPSRSR